MFLGIPIKKNTRNEIAKRPDKIGHLLSCGQNEVGQLGFNDDVIEKTRPALVSGSTTSKAVEISTGGMHSKSRTFYILFECL